MESYRLTGQNKREVQENKNEGLLVFGYSCKLFRDDERALYIDNGRHLIPWMNDDSLMVDRFDVRGALYDLREAESKGSAEVLTDVEIKTEALCEHERYFSLYHDEEEEKLDAEEDKKRLIAELKDTAYNQVGLSYNSDCTNADDLNAQQKVEPVTYNPSADDEYFIPSQELNIPQGMNVPKTRKQDKIIMKTAKFVASQGLQMEIVLKTKQAGNPMFNFLSFDDSLNQYYKHVITLFRLGRIKLSEDKESNAASSEQDNANNMTQNVKPNLAPGTIISMPFQPSANCPYSKLTTKIQETNIVPTSDVDLTPVSNSVQSSNLIDNSAVIEKPPLYENEPKTETSLTVTSEKTSMMDFVNSTFGQENLKEEKANLEPLAFNQVKAPTFLGLVDYPTANHENNECSDQEETSTDHNYRNLPWPPPELQMVIDKMACYIVKNGADFENLVRSKKDPRMGFLETTNLYNKYYNLKLKLYNSVFGELFKNPDKLKSWINRHQPQNHNVREKPLPKLLEKPKKEPLEKPQKETQEKVQKPEQKRDGASICFTIKSREQTPPVTTKTTFPIESSTSSEDEEMDEEEKISRSVAREKRRHERKAKEIKERKEREKERMRRNGEDDEESGNEDLYDIFKYAQELEQENGDKEEETKQEKRKKKAAEFLSKLKENEPPVFGPELPPEIANMLRKTPPKSPSPSSSSSPKTSKISSSRSTPARSLTPRADSPPGISEVLGALMDENSSSEKTAVEKKKSKTMSISEVLASCLDGSEVAEQSAVSRSRSDKKRSRRTSLSPAPKKSGHKLKKRKSSRHHEAKRKRRHSSSRKHKSHHRSSSSRKKKHSRSSHKKRSKHRSSHKKRSKRRRSSSVSESDSSSIESSSRDSTVSTESDSESDIDEVQVIENESVKSKTKNSSRASSVASLISIRSDSADETNKDQKLPNKKLKTIVEESKSRTASPKSISRASSLARSLLPEDSNSSTSLLSRSNGQKPLGSKSILESNAEGESNISFDLGNSTAVAKITQGLRAKLNKLMSEKD